MPTGYVAISITERSRSRERLRFGHCYPTRDLARQATQTGLVEPGLMMVVVVIVVMTMSGGLPVRMMLHRRIVLNASMIAPLIMLIIIAYSRRRRISVRGRRAVRVGGWRTIIGRSI